MKGRGGVGKIGRRAAGRKRCRWCWIASSATAALSLRAPRNRGIDFTGDFQTLPWLIAARFPRPRGAEAARARRGRWGLGNCVRFFFFLCFFIYFVPQKTAGKGHGRSWLLNGEGWGGNALKRAAGMRTARMPYWNESAAGAGGGTARLRAARIAPRTAGGSLLGRGKNKRKQEKTPFSSIKTPKLTQVRYRAPQSAPLQRVFPFILYIGFCPFFGSFSPFLNILKG